RGDLTLSLDDGSVEPPDGGTRARHPLTARNPRTGRRSVYVSPYQTKVIEGLDADASAELLSRLFALVGRYEFTLAHAWQAGHLVMWDQIGVTHARRPFRPSDRRIMRQVVTIFSDAQDPWRDRGVKAAAAPRS